jgi:hypothetical protein
VGSRVLLLLLTGSFLPSTLICHKLCMLFTNMPSSLLGGLTVIFRPTPPTNMPLTNSPSLFTLRIKRVLLAPTSSLRLAVRLPVAPLSAEKTVLLQMVLSTLADLHLLPNPTNRQVPLTSWLQVQVYLVSLPWLSSYKDRINVRSSGLQWASMIRLVIYCCIGALDYILCIIFRLIETRGRL